MELILCYFVQSLGSPFNVLGPKSRNYGGVEGWRGVEGGGPGGGGGMASCEEELHQRRQAPKGSVVRVGPWPSKPPTSYTAPSCKRTPRSTEEEPRMNYLRPAVMLGVRR